MMEKWTHNEIMIDGVNFFYHRTRLEDGPAKPVMVLMHGFSDNGLCWQTMAEELQSSYDIILPDAHGHGLSARVKHGQKFNAAADLMHLLHLLELPSVILGGHSMGAGAAANVAADYPECVRALILEDPPWFIPPTPGSENDDLLEDHSMQDFVVSLQGKTLDQLMAQYRVEHPAWSEIILRRWCEGKQQLDPNFLTTNGLGWDDWREKITSISCPVLLIRAEPEKGGIITSETARVATSLNPNIKAAHIPGAGHHVRFENPDDYMKAVRSFLKKID